MEKQKLELGHFAELARMLKYIDRLDEHPEYSAHFNRQDSRKK